MKAAPRNSPARATPQVGILQRGKAWMASHARSFIFSIGQLARTPAGSAMTTAVIAIALALPNGLYLLIHNVATLGQGWDSGAQIALYLKPQLDDERASFVAAEVEGRADVVSVTLITKHQALAEYRALSGLDDAVQLLAENPLPAVLLVKPAQHAANADAAERLRAELQALPEVDIAQLDLQWLTRLRAMLRIGQQAVAILAALLALGVTLIVGNTIRLSIANQRDEIEIAQLFGATDRFIRRPFLYNGLLLGALGAALAWVLTGLAFALLAPAVARLAALYHSDFVLAGLNPSGLLVLLPGGALLGLVGSWVAVDRYLAAHRAHPR